MADIPRRLADNVLRASCDDLRRPLWNLRRSTATLGAASRLDRRERELVRIMAQHAARAEATLRAMLDAAAARAGCDMAIQRTSCGLDALSLEAIDVATALQASRRFECVESGLSAEVDPARTVQLLLGLLEVAHEHGAAGSAIQLSWRASGDRLLAEVTVLTAAGDAVPSAQLAAPRAIAQAHEGDLRCAQDASGRLSLAAELSMSSRSRGENTRPSAQEPEPLDGRLGP